MSIADTDLVEVLRDGVSYKATGSQVKEYITINSGITATYLVVGGGGGGDMISSKDWGGGGGAGGFLTGTITLQDGVVYSAIVGVGGGPEYYPILSGENSSLSGTGITAITAIGGGKGGHRHDYDHPSGIRGVGYDGGSGGGGSGSSADDLPGGAGTAGQGNNGSNPGRAGGNLGGGGGGGAGSAGHQMTEDANGNEVGGKGGDGKASSITGTSIIYAKGGNGNVLDDYQNDPVKEDGIPNTGNGANNGFVSSAVWTRGGSGVVILRVKTSQYTGNTTGSAEITQDGADTVIRFTDNGTYTA